MTSRQKSETHFIREHQPCQDGLVMAIDVRGLTHEQKKLIWKAHWNTQSGEVEYQNITCGDNVIYVYDSTKRFRGGIARDGGGVTKEETFADMHKPIFEEIVTVTHKFKGTKAPLPKFIEHEGRQYKLVPVKD